MNNPLTEKQIRERASDQSFQKGQAYYKSGAIYNPARQATPGGVTLTAQCEGAAPHPTVCMWNWMEAGCGSLPAPVHTIGAGIASISWRCF